MVSRLAVPFSSRNRKPLKSLKCLILKLNFCVRKMLLRDRVSLMAILRLRESKGEITIFLLQLFSNLSLICLTFTHNLTDSIKNTCKYHVMT